MKMLVFMDVCFGDGRLYRIFGEIVTLESAYREYASMDLFLISHEFPQYSTTSQWHSHHHFPYSQASQIEAGKHNPR